MLSRRRTALLAVTLAFGFGLGGARADTIKVGLTLSATGPAASLGIAQRNSVATFPKQIAGQDVEYIVLDDGGDASRAVANTRKLIDEDNVDIVLGSTVTPAALAMIPVVAEKQVPMIATAASGAIIAPMDAQRRWVFKTPQNDGLMADAIVEHMTKAGIKNVAFIGFSDAYGDGWLKEFRRSAAAAGIAITTEEKYARPDTSVTGQVLKIMATKPQAVLVAGSGTPAALPQKTLREHGYKGPIYQTHGITNNEFLRVGGKDVEGTILPSGPIVVAEQLPDSNPVKAVALDYIHRYEAMYGAGTASAFGANANDAMLLFKAAVPAALAKGKPGTPEFRAGLRDGIEALHGVVLDHGIATMSPTDHNGFDKSARVMLTIQNGAWKLLP
jgi:branched-chain amino acid transport system substrate-binding protein